MNPTFVGAVVITGLVVVFLGLALLILFVTGLGKIFTNKEKKKNNKAQINEVIKEVKIEAKPVIVPQQPIIEDGIDEEIVAVIMASISAMSADTGKKLVLKSLKTSVPQRNAWAFAGLQDNTRPF